MELNYGVYLDFVTPKQWEFFIGVKNMNYLKSLMLIVVVAVSNASESTGLEELMGNMHVFSGWVGRAKAILPTVPCSDELRVEIASMVENLDVNQEEALDAMVTWVGAFMDAEPNTDGANFKAAIRKIFNPTAS